MPCSRSVFRSVWVALSLTTLLVATTTLVARTVGSGRMESSSAAEPLGPFAQQTPLGEHAGVAGDLAGNDDAFRVRILNGIAASGARWVRLGADWAAIEPTRGRYHWDSMDGWVTESRRRHLQALIMPSFTPSWAGPHYLGPPKNPADFARFVHNLVARYTPRGVHVYEIWNEPNLAQFWRPGPDPAAYTRLLRAAYPAAKSAARGVTVVTGGLSPAGQKSGVSITPLTFLKGIYANGGRGFFDAVGHHPYSFPISPIDKKSYNAFISITPALHQEMVDAGDGGKQIWGTEFGSYTGRAAGSISQQNQALFVKQAYQQWIRWPWAAVLFTHSYRDSGINVANQEQNYGLVHYDWTPKPALDVFRTVNRESVTASRLP
jgi:hypothetical protein